MGVTVCDADFDGVPAPVLEGVTVWDAVLEGVTDFEGVPEPV